MVKLLNSNDFKKTKFINALLDKYPGMLIEEAEEIYKMFKGGVNDID